MAREWRRPHRLQCGNAATVWRDDAEQLHDEALERCEGGAARVIGTALHGLSEPILGVRIAFSTNDERTAKRVSDALGTATEMRAMKNYAGHRLSPWLGHLMVSRQETARPLLTPGEVMQLSASEAVVMVSGVHPVRARKVKYYEDPQFQQRILQPSRVSSIGSCTYSDDWSGRKPIQPSAELFASSRGKLGDPNGGIRREPELPQQQDVVIEVPHAVNEFDVLPDEGDADAVQASAFNRSMQGLARSVSLDPDDKMGL